MNRVFVRTSLPIKCQRIISKYQKTCEILFSFWVIHLLLFSVFPVMPKASLKKYLKTWNLFLFVGHNFAPICYASKNLFTSPRIISKSIWIYSYWCWMRFLQSLTFCQINQSREYFLRKQPSPTASNISFLHLLKIFNRFNSILSRIVSSIPGPYIKGRFVWENLVAPSPTPTASPSSQQRHRSFAKFFQKSYFGFWLYIFHIDLKSYLVAKG